MLVQGQIIQVQGRVMLIQEEFFPLRSFYLYKIVFESFFNFW